MKCAWSHRVAKMPAARAHVFQRVSIYRNFLYLVGIPPQLHEHVYLLRVRVYMYKLKIYRVLVFVLVSPEDSRNRCQIFRRRPVMTRKETEKNTYLRLITYIINADADADAVCRSTARTPSISTSILASSLFLEGVQAANNGPTSTVLGGSSEPATTS